MDYNLVHKFPKQGRCEFLYVGIFPHDGEEFSDIGSFFTLFCKLGFKNGDTLCKLFLQ